jgi:hypothetical protein
MSPFSRVRNWARGGNSSAKTPKSAPSSDYKINLLSHGYFGVIGAVYYRYAFRATAMRLSGVPMST